MKRFLLAGILFLTLTPSASAFRWLDDPDLTAPEVTPPAAVSMETAYPAGESVTYGAASATDDVDGPGVPVSCTPASGASFPVGTTSVDCSATDAAGNTGHASFNVTLTLDGAAPILTVSSASVETEDASGTVVNYSASAIDNLDPAPSVICTPASGTFFSLGETSVSCTATDAAGNSSTDSAHSVTVTRVDHTNPSVSVPSSFSVDTETNANLAVSFPSAPSATDNFDVGSLAVSCDHASGDSFPIGTTTIHCSATDTHGNTGNAQFDITVVLVDHTNPVVTVPSSFSVNTETNASAAVSFPTAPSATDNIDSSLSVSCDHASGSSFPIGTTTVQCTATDTHGNTGSGQFNVTVVLVDHTNPVVTAPASFSTETENPSGAAVTYSAPTATDNLDSSVAASCTPASGTTFVIGSTTVNCGATDSHGNHGTASFTITLVLVDHTAPVLTGVSADRHVEANGPAGSIVNFPTPLANDPFYGPVAGVSCAPLSGTKFSIGTTTVNCTAPDGHGNTGSASFQVIVADTTPPNLIVPAPYSVYATTPTGIPNTVGGVVAFLAAASASDIVDPSPTVTNNAPAFLPVGILTIIFSAGDASGNGVSKEVTFIVLPQPPPGTPPLPLPPAPKAPADVRNLTAASLDGAVRLRWQAPPGSDHVVVTRDGTTVYSGAAATFVDRGLVNGTEYRYVVASFDGAGNHSAGVAIVAVPRRNLLRSPKDGARLRKPPKLMWAANAEADYFNAQLLRNGKKILSVWPVKPSFLLKKTWKFQGHKYKLVPGVYSWYVWPGFGARSAVNYGDVLGSRTFQIVR